ncbi:MAG TPA: ethanolamine ammonia-lyase subunit EutC [Stellaceae bacterium]|nr:ethanolamine ammonia-lyase subunit EutC [Stellaceae bacterium]
MTAGWLELRGATPARIGLGRSGAALPTAALLDFQLAHARARDAVHAALDAAGIVAELSGLGLQALHLRSQAPDRPTYLRRPDLGRRLDEESRETLRCQAGEGGNPLGHRASKESVVPGLRRDDKTTQGAARTPVIAFVIADGLSATAVNAHAVKLIAAALPKLGTARIAPVAVVEGGRVAIGDEIGGLLGADLAVVLIGERPGLSAADSLGAYLTWQPAPGATDAARNCLSNIRSEGLPIPAAAETLVGLMASARRHRMTGVALSQRLANPGAITAKGEAG